MKTSTIINSAQETIESGLETVKMSIDSNSIDHLMLNLTNLYADPVLAVIREYVSNGYDSHIRAGQSKPIEVTMPTLENCMFTVEDFGVGMSKQEIIDIYSKYGLSTKNNTNDEIGAFGLGAKSALAIADRFDIVARKNGVETIAYVQKNSKGVGVVHFVSENPTTDPNGFKVSVPVAESNVSEFNRKTRFFDTWKEGTVLVNGEPTAAKQYSENWLEINPNGDVEPVGWVKINNSPVNYRVVPNYLSMYNMFENVSFIIGGVPYEFPRDAQNSALSIVFENEGLKEKIASLLAYDSSMIINLPIGSVDLTPNRESIMLNEKSASTISSLLLDFVNNAETMAVQKVNTMDRVEALNFIANNFSLFKVETQGKAGYSRYYSDDPFIAAGVREESSGVSWQGNPVPVWLDCENTPVYHLFSTNGVGLKDWQPGLMLPILNIFNRNKGAVNVLVKTSDLSEATLTSMRNYLRDYSKAVSGSADIIAVATDSTDILENEWVKATYTIVDYAEYVDKGKEFRRDRKSAAQSGVKRSSIGYSMIDYTNVASFTDKATVEYVNADDLPAEGEGVVFFPIGNYTWWGNSSEINYGASNVEEKVEGMLSRKSNSEVAYNGFLKYISPVVEGSKVVLLNKNKKPEAFAKRYPKAVSLNDKFADTVAKYGKDKALSVQLKTLVSLLYRPTVVSGSRFQYVGSMVEAAQAVTPHLSTPTSTNANLYNAFMNIHSNSEVFRVAQLFSLATSGANATVDSFFAEAVNDSLYGKLSLISYAPYNRYSARQDEGVLSQVVSFISTVS